MISDHEAIVKIKNGEIDFFSVIVERYTPSIMGFIKTKLNKKEDAEDLVQNVFISFYKSIDRFDMKKPVKPYLYQIVQNELKMFYRNRKITMPLKEEIAADVPVEKEYDELDLKNLSVPEKNILLSLADGFTYREIARKFKKPINTLKSIVRRARIKLKIKGN